MKTSIIKLNDGYIPVIDGISCYYSLDGQQKTFNHTPWGALTISKPSPTLAAAKRRITRAGLTWEPESPLTLTVTEAAKLAGVTRPTIISWIHRGRLIPKTFAPDPVTFTRRAVEKAMADRKDVKPGAPKKIPPLIRLHPASAPVKKRPGPSYLQHSLKNSFHNIVAASKSSCEYASFIAHQMRFFRLNMLPPPFFFAHESNFVNKPLVS